MSLLEVTNERIEQFLSKNKRKLAYMESYFSIDDNRDKKEDFTEDKLKVLCVFLTPASSRAVSNTFNALMTCCKKADMDNVVVDSCYYPEDANMELLEKEGIPYIFGSTCHQPASFYDLILMSNAVCPEVLNIPKFLHHSGLGLTIEERDKQDVPLIIMGGAAANETSIVLGPINRDGKCIGKSMVDMANYGYGEQMMTEIAGAFLRFKKEGINLHSRKEVRERLIDEKVAHDYLFFPEYYEWVYDEDKFNIKEIKKLDDRLPDRVGYNRIHSEEFGWDYKTFNLSGDNADSHDLQISTGCSGSSSCCAFCMESTVAGHYTEKRLETVIEQMKEVRRHCAPNTLSYFSFNLNYYYRFMDLLAESSKYFSGVTLLNERVDIIANSPEQMQLAKKLGLKRVSMAIEGMGERVRDGILNKNLPHETLMQGIRVVSKLGVMMVKFGLIITGQETEEDFQEWIKELEEMNKIRDEEGSNHAWQINHTPMVFYSQIAMRHLPRITSENCYNNVKTMGTMVEAYKRLGYRAKYNGKGCGTWLEQLLLDFGPAGTDWMVGLVLDQGLGYIRFFGDKMKQAATEELKKRGYEDPLFFTFARPQDWIFPNDHINYASDELKKMWWDRTVAMNFDTKLCLRTAANLDNVKCYGCKACSSPEEIKGMVKREMCDEHTFEEVAEMLSDSRNQKTVRVVVKMDPKWFFYNRTSLAHYITSRFLQKSDVICDNFYSVGKTTTTWLSSNGQKGWFGGNWCFDINLRGPVSVNEFTEVIEEINSELESCKILRVIDDTKTQLVKRETNITFLGQTTEHSMSRIKDRLSNFEWDIKVPIKSMGGQLDTEIKHMPELKEKVLFAQAGNRIMIGMDLPAHISPYMVMSSILGKPYEKMLEDFAFDVVDQYSEVDMVDEKGHHLGYSYFDACYTKEAPIEKIRKYLYKLTKR